MPKTSWFIADSKTPADDDGLMTTKRCVHHHLPCTVRCLFSFYTFQKVETKQKSEPKGSKICFSRPNYKWASAMTTGQVLSHITAISCFVSVLGWKKCVSPPIALLRWKPCWFGSLKVIYFHTESFPGWIAKVCWHLKFDGGTPMPFFTLLGRYGNGGPPWHMLRMLVGQTTTFEQCASWIENYPLPSNHNPKIGIGRCWEGLKFKHV